MSASSRECPCGSGASYAACCAPLHRGDREASDATALMRSRYAAFAKKEALYLWKTLHPDHDDRARPEDEVIRDLRAACSSNRYMGLTILDARGADANGMARVLFEAKVFRRGEDLSFVELSEFLHDGVGWRYLRGDGASIAEVRASGATTIDAFVARLVR